MDAPDTGYRTEIWQRLQQLPNIEGTHRFVNPDVEQGLQQILDDIQERLRGAIANSEVLSNDVDEDAANDVLSAIDAWAGLASYATAWVYAPQSPMPWGLGGWIRDVPSKLREIAEDLRGALLKILHALRVNSWSIGVSFPWGVSVSLTWNVT